MCKKKRLGSLVPGMKIFRDMILYVCTVCFVLPIYATNQTSNHDIESLKQRIHVATTELHKLRELIAFQPFTASWLAELWQLSTAVIQVRSLQQDGEQIIIQGKALPGFQATEYATQLNKSLYFTGIVVREPALTSENRNVVIQGMLEYPPTTTPVPSAIFPHHTSVSLTYDGLKETLREIELQIKDVSKKLVNIRSLYGALKPVEQVLEETGGALWHIDGYVLEENPSRFSFTLDVSGTYRDFVTFVTALSDMNDLITVDHVVMFFDDGKIGKISCQLVFYKEP